MRLPRTALARLMAALLLAMTVGPAFAATVRVAVAANFQETARQLAAKFESQSGDRVVLSVGSTGTLYAQIRQGAPFDVFFAADVARPKRLEKEGATVPHSRVTYAVGRLVLWSTKPGLVDGSGEVLRKGGFQRLAIANPKLAPYGKAAEQTLRALGLWQRFSGRLVTGQNISQTHQFVASGSAELGFVALSQVQRPGAPAEGSSWLVPARLYDPIEQQAVLLHNKPAAAAFLDYVKGPDAATIIRSYGYALP